MVAMVPPKIIIIIAIRPVTMVTPPAMSKPRKLSPQDVTLTDYATRGLFMRERWHLALGFIGGYLDDRSSRSRDDG